MSTFLGPEAPTFLPGASDQEVGPHAQEKFKVVSTKPPDLCDPTGPSQGPWETTGKGVI